MCRTDKPFHSPAHHQITPQPRPFLWSKSEKDAPLPTLCYAAGMTLSRRWLLASALTAAGTLPLTRMAYGQAAHRLTILHMNDFHSRHEPVDGRALACSADHPDCFGGSARLATAIRTQRAAAAADGRAVLLLDAGDQFQGSLFFTAHRGMAELAVMHELGTDAMAAGNHEFDLGPAVLGAFADAARFPVLSANVDATAEPALAGRLRPHAILERAGLRVGLIGLTTQQAEVSSSPGPNVRFNDPAPALAAAAIAARAAGAQVLLVLSHLGVFLDGTMDAPGVAAIIGGHTHTLLSNVEPGALGPHPVRAGSGALVVQAGAYGRYLGRLDLDLAADGTVLAYGGECRHVGLDLPEDPAVAAVVARFAAPLREVRLRPVTTLPEALDVAGCRVGPCGIGEMVAGALLDAAHGADLAVMNAGGIRTGLRGGVVTLGDVLDALPFGNMLATLTLTGADVRAALEQGLQPGRGAFPQVAGIRMAFDPTRPAGDRITMLEVRGADGTWAPLDPARRYLVATNNFMRNGGDGYTVMRDRAVDSYDAGPGVAEIVAAALGR